MARRMGSVRVRTDSQSKMDSKVRTASSDRMASKVRMVSADRASSRGGDRSRDKVLSRGRAVSNKGKVDSKGKVVSSRPVVRAEASAAGNRMAGKTAARMVDAAAIWVGISEQAMGISVATSGAAEAAGIPTGM